MQKLIRITKFLQLNEFEITIWSLWLKQLEWNSDNLSLESFLFATGIQAKGYANSESELEEYLKRLEHDFPKVKKQYDSWVKVKKHLCDFSLREINREYRKLFRVFYFNYIDFTTKFLGYKKQSRL